MATRIGGSPHTLWTQATRTLQSLASAPTRALRQAARLKGVPLMKARAAVQALEQQWSQSLSRAHSRPASSPPRQSPRIPPRASAAGPPAGAKEQFFAAHREQLRGGQYWARQDGSGQWRLERHESNRLHSALEGLEGFAQGVERKAYDLVTLPCQLAEFAASPAGETFRNEPEKLARQLAIQGRAKAQQLAFDVPSGKALEEAVKPFAEGTARERGQLAGGLTFEVATLLPVAKLTQGAGRLLKLAERAAEGLRVTQLSEETALSASAVKGPSPGLSSGRGSQAASTLDAMEEAPDLPESARLGRLGGDLYGSEKLKQLEGYLARRGIELKVGDEFMPPRKAGGFDGVQRQLILRSHPTRYEVSHELGHYLDFKKKGAELYNNPELHGRVAKEQVVFDMLNNSEKRWAALTEQEQQHARWYIEDVGGFW